MLLALAMFAATWPVGVWLRRRRRLAEPFPILRRRGRVPDEAHAVAGHARPASTTTSTVTTAATPRSAHGDHVDYVHDGHRHAPHGEHYDEH